MSADTHLVAVPPDVKVVDWRDLYDYDSIWIGQGGRTWVGDDGRLDFSYAPQPVHFIHVLFEDSPILTVGLMKSAMNALNMPNTSGYGTRMEVLTSREALDANWGSYVPGRHPYIPDSYPSRGGIDRRLRLPGGKRRMFFRARGTTKLRPAKQFLERNLGMRIMVTVE